MSSSTYLCDGCHKSQQNSNFYAHVRLCRNLYLYECSTCDGQKIYWEKDMKEHEGHKTIEHLSIVEQKRKIKEYNPKTSSIFGKDKESISELEAQICNLKRNADEFKLESEQLRKRIKILEESKETPNYAIKDMTFITQSGQANIYRAMLQNVKSDVLVDNKPIIIKEFNKERDWAEEQVAQNQVNHLDGVRKFHPEIEIKYMKRWIMVFDYYDGTLDQLAMTTTHINNLTRHIFLNMAKTLEGLHDRNIVHMDIKPGNFFYNILSNASSKLIQVFIGDFGLAKFTDSTTRIPNAGTKCFKAPEVYNSGGACLSSDIYSLGMSFLVLLCHVHYDTVLKTLYSTAISTVASTTNNNTNNNSSRITTGYNPAVVTIALAQLYQYGKKEVYNTYLTMINEMLTYELEKRPTINQVIKRLTV
jgi:serine/threonine protein kinase